MTDSILSLIDNAIEDYGLGPDAMRWRPEAPGGRSASTDLSRPSAWASGNWSRQQRSEEFRLHDHMPAQNDWPGGNRYGYTREVIWSPRTWSEADRLLAARWRVVLPDVDERVVELWWDMPRRHTVSLVTSPVEVSFFEPVDPIAEVEFRQEVRAARRYGSSRWLIDPLAWARRMEASEMRERADG